MKYLLLTIFTTLLSTHAAAACTGSPVYAHISKDMIINPNVPINTPVADWSEPSYLKTHYCSSDPTSQSSSQQILGKAVRILGTYAGRYTIYDVNLAGMGMIYEAKAPNTSSWAPVNQTSNNVGGGHLSHPAQWEIQNRFRLIKTGNIPPTPQRANTRTYSRVTIVQSPFGARTSYDLTSPGILVTPHLKTCSLNAGDFNAPIDLGNVKTTDFNDSEAVKHKYFTISATCDAQADVTFKFTGTPDANSSWHFANSDTKTGIALGLYSHINNTLETIRANGTNNERTIKTVGNIATLPLAASYFKTSSVIQGGELHSQVQVNITYK